jgi:hypothetical protein
MIFWYIKDFSACLNIERTNLLTRGCHISKCMGKIKNKNHLIEMHHYVTNMWCKQYIESITSIWQLRKKSLHMGKFDMCYTFPTTFQLQIVYYKYMLNSQWRLFCRLGSRVTSFKLLHIQWHELPLHLIFLCYSKGVLKHTFDIFTIFSHVIVT